MSFKKILLFVLILLLVGCTNSPIDDNEEPIEEEIIKLEEINTWIKSVIPNIVRDDLLLPVSHPTLGGSIVWESYNPETIGNDGKLTSKAVDSEVMLGYTIALDTIEDTVSDVVVIKVIVTTIDEIANRFANQFSAVITRDYNVKTDYYSGAIITWSSSDTSCFTNEGVYIKPENDKKITINYTIDFLGEVKSYTKEVSVQGTTFSEKVSEIKTWITSNYLTSKEIDSEINLPTVYEKYNAKITWRSGNVGVISNDGTVKQYGFDRYVSLEGTLNIGGDNVVVEYSVVVKAKQLNTKEEKITSFLEAVATPELERLEFTSYYNINQSYNFLPFYQNVDAPVTVQLKPLGGSRPGTKLYSLEYVTIHDTANNNIGAGAQTHANLLTNGYNSASWHYSVDDIGAWRSIPHDEVAWHAGDGGNRFNLTDTNVKATITYPIITISADGFYELNGQKSVIKAPLVAGKTAKTSDITPSGLYTEIGANGNYYLNTTYFNTDFGKISNGGGNRNSIGIETCVNQGVDYAQTLRHTAKLVAEILIENNLSVDRVLQHNNFSGKDCPNAMRHVNYWNNFLDLISLEKYAKENLSDVTFNWNSLSPILDNNGKIATAIGTNASVNYMVTVTFGSENITRQFSTVLKG